MKKSAVIVLIAFMLTCPGAIAFPKIIEKPIVPTFRNGNTLYVGGTGPGNYSNIQDAVDDASNDDTIFVYSYSSPYCENVVVEKSINLIGEDKNSTIIDGMGTDDPLWIRTSSVDVHGFTMMNCPKTALNAGIHIIEKKVYDELAVLTDITVSDCILKNNKCVGIWMESTQRVDISNCDIKNNDGLSILISDSSQVTVTNCEIHENGEELGPGTGYSGGILTRAGDFGGCYDVEISYCDITNNKLIGISTSAISHNIDIHHNVISHNSWRGIAILGGYFNLSSNIVIHDNIISENGEGRDSHGGILIQDCRDIVTVKHNNISSNNNTGIYLLRASQNTIIENNIIDHERNGYFEEFCFLNQWDENYWDDWIRSDEVNGPWKAIKGRLIRFIPWVNFDRHPASEPYLIT